MSQSNNHTVNQRMYSQQHVRQYKAVQFLKLILYLIFIAIKQRFDSKCLAVRARRATEGSCAEAGGCILVALKAMRGWFSDGWKKNNYRERLRAGKHFRP
jgi:hypothetical protein